MLSVDDEEEEMRPNVQCMPLQWFAYLILQYGTSDRYPRREDAVALGVLYGETLEIGIWKASPRQIATNYECHFGQDSSGAGIWFFYGG